MPRYDDIYISTNNLRMNFPIFDISPILTCPGSTNLCEKYCYALKSERLYPHTRSSRLSNYHATKKPTFTSRMITYINTLNPKYFRVHASGDFYNQNYLNKWIKIWKALPQTNFLAYTQHHTLDYTKLPPNIKLYHSIWPDSLFHNIPKNTLRAYVIDTTYRRLPPYRPHIQLGNTFTCPKTHTKGKCNDCMHCFNGVGDVVFELH